MEMDKIKYYEILITWNSKKNSWRLKSGEIVYKVYQDGTFDEFKQIFENITPSGYVSNKPVLISENEDGVIEVNEYEDLIKVTSEKFNELVEKYGKRGRVFTGSNDKATRNLALTKYMNDPYDNS